MTCDARPGSGYAVTTLAATASRPLRVGPPHRDEREGGAHDAAGVGQLGY